MVTAPKQPGQGIETILLLLGAPWGRLAPSQTWLGQDVAWRWRYLEQGHAGTPGKAQFLWFGR